MRKMSIVQTRVEVLRRLKRFSGGKKEEKANFPNRTEMHRSREDDSLFYKNKYG
uniref:Uncharacterized protein n=1 Tax=Cucumis melo TaxID=3656 RepID=A0A9I9CH37_CUCME